MLNISDQQVGSKIIKENVAFRAFSLFKDETADFSVVTQLSTRNSGEYSNYPRCTVKNLL